MVVGRGHGEDFSWYGDCCMIDTFYKLENGKIFNTDIETWAKNMKERKHVLWQDDKNDIFVSTVFLGLDHGHLLGGPPVLFETMVFGDDIDHMERYLTLEEAKIGHKRVVKKYL